MFNSEYKKAFIQEKSEVTFPYNFLQRTFENAAPFEEKWERDLSNWNSKEIIEFYKYLGSSSTKVLENINGVFKDYTQYCLSRHIVEDMQNHYLEFRYDELSKYTNKLYKNDIYTREEVLYIVNRLKNPCDSFIILALFEGIKGNSLNEIINAKLSDINGNIITLCTGRELEISDELVDLAKKSESKYSYYDILTGTEYMLENSTDVIVKFKDSLNKNVKDIIFYKRLYMRFRQITEYFKGEYNISISGIFESGRINYIKSLMQKDEDVYECLLREKDKVAFRYSYIVPGRYTIEYKDYF